MEIIFVQVPEMMLLFTVQILFQQETIIVWRLMRPVKVPSKLNGNVLKLQLVTAQVLVPAILANVIQVSYYKG